MGLDVMLWTADPPAPEFGARLSEEFAKAFTAEHTFTTGAAPRVYPSLDADGHVNTLWRYYGPGYERGPWPEIRRCIDWLMAATEGEGRYCSDALTYERGEAPILTRDDLDEIQRHWDEHGNEPYRRPFTLAAAPGSTEETTKP